MERPYAPLERQYAEIAITTAGPWTYLSRVIDFPTKPSTILDIGAGGSDVTAELLKRGHNAFAIDPRYEDPDLIRKKVEESYTKRDPNSPLREHWEQLTRDQEQALTVFYRSREENPSNYIPATGTALPFKDGTFDLVFSVNAVTEYLDLNKHLLQDAVFECLRVTKPGGRVELHPLKLKPPDIEKATVASVMTVLIKQINHRRLFERLVQEGIDYEIAPVGRNDHKLIIHKD